MTTEQSPRFQNTNFYKVFREFISQIEHETLIYRSLLPKSKDFNQEKNNLAATYLGNIFKLCFERIDIAFSIILPVQTKMETCFKNQELSPLPQRFESKTLIRMIEDIHRTKHTNKIEAEQMVRTSRRK